MPEGPEVFAVSQALKKILVNRVIEKVEVLFCKLSQDDLTALVNQRVKDVYSQAKYLVIVLSKSYLVVHLRMEGKFKLADYHPLDKHTHLILTLSDGNKLYYHDVRKFGRFYLTADINQFFKERQLAIDARDLSLKQLQQLLAKRKSNIKACLLNQQLMGGIGNIYADEILFAAKIHPLTLASELSLRAIKRLHQAIKSVLSAAYEQGGTSIHSFKIINDISGRFQQQLKVYGRHNQECVVCQNTLIKIKVNQRGTTLCPHCQKRP